MTIQLNPEIAARLEFHRLRADETPEDIINRALDALMLAKLWMGDSPTVDDFGYPITDEFIDGKTDPKGSFHGTWATFSPYTWKRYGCGTLGLGFGQRYVKQRGGSFFKVEG
jgi:hypothetical protein